MYNRKSKISAILAILTALLIIGFLVMLPLLKYEQGEGDNAGAVIGLILIIIYGYPLIYASAIPFAIVALIFGIKMLRQQSRKRLISLNVRMLITTCVLLPFLIVGFVMGSAMVFHSTLGLFPPIYVIVTSISYIAGLIAQIAAIIILKKSPEESAPAVPEE